MNPLIDDHASADGPGGPAVIGANTYAFRPTERLRNDIVASTCLVWVITGRGVIRTNSQIIEMTKGSTLWLPWRHDVQYDADARDPFRIGTVHVVPWHDAGIGLEARVPFQTSDPLLFAEHRRGTPGKAVEVSPTHPDAARLVALGGYTIDRFNREQTGDVALRALGELFDEELLRLASGEIATGPRPPIAFQLMRDYVEQNLDHRITVADVARSGDCSASTAERLFTRWAGAPVLSWTRDRRMDKAASLLSTTGLRVGEVARAVGFEDALYFSRVFAAAFGVPPSRYAAARIRP